MAPQGRNGQLALTAVVMVLAMATWFSASAVAPAIRADWGVGARDATWLTGAVQLGFVAGGSPRRCSPWRTACRCAC